MLTNALIPANAGRLVEFLDFELEKYQELKRVCQGPSEYIPASTKGQNLNLESYIKRRPELYFRDAIPNQVGSLVLHLIDKLYCIQKLSI